KETKLPKAQTKLSLDQINKIPKQGEMRSYYNNEERENFKIRPVLIMSNDWQNQHDKYSIIAPLTSDKKELEKSVASFEVLIEPNEKNGLDATSKILLNRLQIVDKNFRLIRKVGQVDTNKKNKTSKNLNQNDIKELKKEYDNSLFDYSYLVHSDKERNYDVEGAQRIIAGWIKRGLTHQEVKQ
ncbi:4508_t:CDS:2, partial [Racocetra persica]